MRWSASGIGPLACALGVLLVEGACAERSYQLPVQSPPTASAGLADAGLPPPPPPSRRGVILPGDPSSGTAQLGPNSTGVSPNTGTSGPRVTPGSSEGSR